MLQRLLTVLAVSVLAVCMLGLGLLPASATPATAATPGAPGAPVGAPTWFERAQQRLNALGCNAGPVDGRNSEHTRAAVVRFQSRHGLGQNGRLDPPTRTRLRDERAMHCDTRPVPAHTGTGRRIVISQRQNWVWLVRADGRNLAQSGMVDNPSVLRPGTTRVGSYCGRSARIRHNTDGHGLWLDNFVRFAPCGIGFHRIPRHMSNGHQIHADWLVGTNLRTSHGCIRVPRPFSQQVWRFAHVGTAVHVIGR